MTTAQIAIPPKLRPVFAHKRGALRYRCAYGGRGSGKSFSFALMAAVWGCVESLRVLCTRELQVSIKESFHAELKAAIASQPWLSAHYDVGIDYLRGKNGTEFIFRGLRHNMGSIKSMAKIDLCIVEEAEDVPEQSWVDLEPTIRAPNSEIWVVWNPRLEGSPVDKRFIHNTPPRSRVVKLNYADNPRFPMVLEEQRQHARQTLDPGLYAHIWDGDYWSASAAQILNGKWTVQDFTAHSYWNGPYFGADWGFAQDPTTLVKLWVFENVLYVEHEAYEVGVEIDHTPALFRKVPDAEKHTIRADSARPETISYMRRQGFNVRGAEKGKGSVEDGIAHLLGYTKIIIHSRCKHAIQEARLWSYKVDRLSGDILPKPADGNDHCIAEGVLITTMRGDVAIENITTDDFVMTRGGWQRVLYAGQTDVNRDILRVETNGGIVFCTPDHEIWVEQKGFLRADAIRYDDDIILIKESLWLSQKLMNITGKFIAAIRMQKIEAIEFILKNQEPECHQYSYIGKYGLIILGLFQKGFTFITKIMTRAITLLKILNAQVVKIILSIIRYGAVMMKDLKIISTEYDRLQRTGMQAKKAEKSMLKLAQWPTRHLFQWLKNANTALLNLIQNNQDTQINTAQIHANQQQGVNQESITSSKRAHAEKNLQLINTKTLRIVRGRVLTITEHGKANRVFDLTVENHHEFFANGVLVSNCWDAARYALEPIMKRGHGKSGITTPTNSAVSAW